MTARCTYGACRGSLLAEPNEQTLTDRRPTVLRCASCGREAGAKTTELVQEKSCIEPGCLKAQVGGGSSLCANHRAVATRRARRVG